jgi:hypothetical protein
MYHFRKNEVTPCRKKYIKLVIILSSVKSRTGTFLLKVRFIERCNNNKYIRDHLETETSNLQ